jgi:hypothetical protein
MESLAIMVVLPLVSALAGAVLRLRWTVLSVVPAMVVATIVIASVGIARSSGFWPIALAAAASSVSLQAGYLGGQALGRAIESVRGWRPPR